MVSGLKWQAAPRLYFGQSARSLIFGKRLDRRGEQLLRLRKPILLARLFPAGGTCLQRVAQLDL